MCTFIEFFDFIEFSVLVFRTVLILLAVRV